MSLADADKVAGVEVARSLRALGFRIAATVGTAGYLRAHGVEVDTLVGKIAAADLGVDAVGLIASGEVNMVINTPSGRSARADGAAIRMACTVHKVACMTTLSAAQAAVMGISDTRSRGWRVTSLQELHG